MKNIFRRRRRRRCSSNSVAPEPTEEEPQLFDSDVVSEIRHLQSYTDLDIKKRQPTIITCRPYFGIFAGRVVVFEMDGARTRVSVDGAPITTGLNFSRVIGSVEDKCILFLHCESNRDTQYKIPPPQPHSLQFLCKRSILLHGALPPGTPLQLAQKLSQTAKQTLHVTIWPSCSRRPSGASASDQRMKIRVPVHLTFGELASFVRVKVGLPSSVLSLRFRECDGIYDLQSSRPLQMKHADLNCFVDMPQNFLSPLTTGQRTLPVAMIGSGKIRETRVTPWTTVAELESAIKELFKIKDDNSFIYMPALFRAVDCRLSMYGNASTTTGLLDKRARNFPIVADHRPYIKTDYRQLSIYQRPLSDTPLLEDSLPLICFEVTGPTVPLAFKAFDFSDEGIGNFATIAHSARILSINPQWNATTLLKYIDCISSIMIHKRLVNKGSVVPHNTKIKKLFSREWMVTDPAGRRTLSPSVLRVE